MNIGQASEKSGLPPKTIRYYEDIELVVPLRQENGYRLYSETDVNQLGFINHARDLGFDVETCRKLLTLYVDQSRTSAEVKSLAIEHLTKIEAKMKELRKMSKSLKTLINKCEGNGSPKCAIIDGLSGRSD